jgi:hypothetical protein
MMFHHRPNRHTLGACLTVFWSNLAAQNGTRFTETQRGYMRCVLGALIASFCPRKIGVVVTTII